MEFLNLAKHIEIIRAFGVEPVVALNRFITDSPTELDAILTWCKANGTAAALTDVWGKGGEGGLALGKEVIKLLEKPNSFAPLYNVESSVFDKVTTIVRKVYGGENVIFTDKAMKNLEDIERNGWDVLPICMAKTQYSFSDNPKLIGRPKGFTITSKGDYPEIRGRLSCLLNWRYYDDAGPAKTSSCFKYGCRCGRKCPRTHVMKQKGVLRI